MNPFLAVAVVAALFAAGVSLAWWATRGIDRALPEPADDGCECEHCRFLGVFDEVAERAFTGRVRWVRR
jgi:hypothetical protein